jgi:hypothetical protein
MALNIIQKIVMLARDKIEKKDELALKRAMNVEVGERWRREERRRRELRILLGGGWGGDDGREDVG